MKKTIIYTAFWLATAGISFTSCEDVFGGFLDKQPSNELTEERMVYRECIPSGQVDLQNITVGDVIKRAWNFAVNRPPKLQNLLALG